MTSDPSSPVDRSTEPAREPTPRVGTPATESSEESVEHERDAVGDAPDVGDLTPPDAAQ